ncbi:MAG: hypothetical protein GKR77_03305 [Legionellales bacterium]|nr:hypothetical protein [Legionellales bacterium]
MTIVYCNGQFSQADSATISCQDRGLLLGDGFFDTLLVQHGHIPWIDYHWHRLLRTASKIQISLPLTQPHLLDIAQTLVERNHFTADSVGLRITITRGCGERALLPTGTETPQYWMYLFAKPEVKPRVSLATTNIRRNASSPLVTMKSTNYLEAILAHQQVAVQDADDVLWLNHQQHVCETSVANIFLINHQQVITPPLDDGVLPGVTRQVLLELCAELSIDHMQQSITLPDCYAADAVLITNTLKPIQRVHQINHQPLTTAKSDIVTTLTQQYHRRLQELLKQQISRKRG